MTVHQLTVTLAAALKLIALGVLAFLLHGIVATWILVVFALPAIAYILISALWRGFDR